MVCIARFSGWLGTLLPGQIWSWFGNDNSVVDLGLERLNYRILVQGL